MKIAIASDHAGYHLKARLVEVLNLEVADLGCHSTDSVDYPDVACSLAARVAAGEFDRGILLCGSGIGVSIAANRIPGVRAALCNEPLSVRLAREHNDANVLCLGARLIGEGMAVELIKTFLETPFAAGRHQRRVELLDQIRSHA